MEEEVAKVALVMLTTGFLIGGTVVFIVEEFVKYLWRN
jgi:hypothetical protein